nr:zinc-finger homeodomain protein 9-like [Ipomoea batatas]GMD01110.1 zinc-finger homeodomain protein 9-like [Ipomoea batatas]
MDLGGLGSSNTTVKTPETETQTPTILLHHAKPLSFSSNGVLKRHNPLHHAVVVTYKECLKNHAASLGGHAKKRFRTKFTQDQKDKMLEFADKVGWKIQKRDEELISQFCTQVGVERGVLKVWMHNNKNTLCKNQSQSNIDNVNGLDSSRNPAAQFNLHQESNGNDTQNHQPLHNSEDVSANTIAVNGSSSSS